MNYTKRDNEIFNLIKNGEITELVCIKECYSSQGQHTLNNKYFVYVTHFVYIETNFGYPIDIINGSGVSLYFETEQQYNILKRKEKIEKIRAL